MIIVVRHGRTEANASGLLLGRSDPSLDELGRRQAEAAGVALRGVEAVISSPLARCRETADAIASLSGATVAIDDRFIELNYGDWEGRPVAEVTGDEWTRWRADIEFEPPGGESLAALGTRVRRGLDDLVERAIVDDVVVVTHVSPMKAAEAWALGVGDEVSWRMFVSNASIIRIAVARGPSLHAFGEIAHLRGL